MVKAMAGLFMICLAAIYIALGAWILGEMGVDGDFRHRSLVALAARIFMSATVRGTGGSE